ncbi:MAG: methyltransferase family protein [Candidatus Odinarchaeota archaeon]
MAIYWGLFQKAKNREKKIIKVFYKIFPVIWAIVLFPIPILNTSFLKFYFTSNYSYFEQYWIFFALFGIALIILSVSFAKRAYKLYKRQSRNENKSYLITTGIFRLIRHPIYSAWGLFFLGIAILSDSFTSLIISPLIFIILEIHAIFEEKLILIPKYGEEYENYKNKTPNRIIPRPLNLLLILISIIIVYVGFLNFI